MTNPLIEQRRQDYLEWLYHRSGRTNGLYTGLFQGRLQELLLADMAAVKPRTPLSERVGSPAIIEIAAWLRDQGLDLSAEALLHEA